MLPGNITAMTKARWNARLLERRGRPRAGPYTATSRTWIAEITGISRATVSRVLNGSRRCPPRLTMYLARVLGISVEHLERDLRVAQGRRNSCQFKQ